MLLLLLASSSLLVVLLVVIVVVVVVLLLLLFYYSLLFSETRLVEIIESACEKGNHGVSVGYQIQNHSYHISLCQNFAA